MNTYPLLIEFVPGTRISRDPEFVEFVSTLPIVQNGPPGTSVVFEDGAKVPLPTDEIVLAEDRGGAAHVGFGGMSSVLKQTASSITDRWPVSIWYSAAGISRSGKGSIDRRPKFAGLDAEPRGPRRAERARRVRQT